MHVIHRTKEEKPRDFIRTESTFSIPGHRKTRNRRYDAHGNFLGLSRPKPIPNPVIQAKVRRAMAEGAAKGLPAPEVPFDMSTYRPLPGRVLVERAPKITELKGVALPEEQWKQQPYFVCVAIGSGVTRCSPGDRVVFAKGWRPKEAWLGRKFYLGREEAVVGIVE